MKSKYFFTTALMVSLFLVAIGNSFGQGRPSMGKQSLAMLESSPAGSRVIDFIKMVNAKGDPADDAFKEIISQKLIDKHGLAKLKSMLIGDIKENDGKLTVYVVNRAEQFKYEVFAKGETEPEAWLKLEVFLEEQDPYKIRGLGLDMVDDAPDGVDKPMKIG